MNKIKKINDFLHLIAEISKSGVIVDPNLVYSNLIQNGIEKISIKDYFYDWQDRFCKVPNISIFVSPTWDDFCQFESLDKTDGFDMLKIYIPFDESHIHGGVNRLFEYLSENNIIHKSLVSSSIRLDDVIVRVNEPNDINNIIRFVYDNLEEGLLMPNPFMFNIGATSIIWDGILSYNVVLSEWISEYINSVNLEDVSYESFYEYVGKRYKEVFQLGNGIDTFKMSVEKLANYQRITELLLIALRKDSKLTDLYRFHKFVINPDSKKEAIDNIERLKRKEKRKPVISNEAREAFDYTFYEQSIKESPEAAVKRFKKYIEDGDLLSFTRANGIRTIAKEMIDIETTKRIIFEEEKQALINASLETLKKHGTIVLGKALFGIKNGDYQSFTNDNNDRERLKMWVYPDEIDELIHNILIDEGYENIEPNDEYWLFMGIIEKSLEKAK